MTNIFITNTTVYLFLALPKLTQCATVLSQQMIKYLSSWPPLSKSTFDSQQGTAVISTPFVHSFISSSVECCQPACQVLICTHCKSPGLLPEITSAPESAEHLLHHGQHCPESSANHCPQWGARVLPHRFRFCLFCLLVDGETLPKPQCFVGRSWHHRFPVWWHGHVKNSRCVTW